MKLMAYAASLLLLFSWFYAPRLAIAQEPNVKLPTISVTASYSVNVKPSTLRLNLPVRVETQLPDSLLKTLSNHQAQVKKHLAGMNAVESSIEFSPPQITSGVPGIDNPEAAKKSVRQQAIQMRNMNPHMKAQFPVPSLDEIDDLALPVVYAATTNLLVDWNLKNGIDDEAILMPAKLKRIMDEKDFTGKKLRVELTEDEQSMIEPLMGNNSYYVPNSSGTSQYFYYVGELTEDQEKQAYEEAFKRAKNEANVIASAAGLKRGRMRSIQKGATTQDFPTVVTQYGSSTVVQTHSSDLQKSQREIIQVNPSELKKTVSVTVVFELE